MQHAMIIDYKYCTGCESCVVSCAKEKGLGAEEWGMKVEQIGPNKIGGKWEWDYVPVLSIPHMRGSFPSLRRTAHSPNSKTHHSHMTRLAT